MNKIKKILIVDDDDTSNFLTEMMLKKAGICDEIEILSNGKEAIDYFSFESSRFPDLILLDINMPLTNGFEFLEWYIQHGHSGKTKIAMYSTSLRSEDKDRSMLYQDVIDYIEKPITREKIDTLVSRLQKITDSH